jgi:beta-N-acetylhexosaminidase
MGDQREARRKRRKRNQTIVYVVTVIFILGVVAGIFFGAQFILGRLEESAAAEAAANAEETVEKVVVVPTEEPTPEPTPEVDPLDELVAGIVSNMTLEEKVAQLFMITPEDLTGYTTVVKAGDSTKAALEEFPVGGLIYFSQNLQDEEQVTEMLANTVQYSKYVPFIAVDEEGGVVSRVADSDLEATSYDDLNVLGESMMEADAIVMGSTIGEYLSKYGFNVNLAPVADVLINENSPMKDRILSADSTRVASLSTGIVNGLQSKEVSACMKHFPGLGSVAEDSHDILPITERTLTEMQSAEFLPFISGIEAGVDMIMVGHIAAPAVTETAIPSSLSKVMVTDILRTDLGFEGVIITDSMQMDAITNDYTSADAALIAIGAGVDMILMPENFEEAYQAILDAVTSGVVTEERINESVHRILYAKYKYTELAN